MRYNKYIYIYIYIVLYLYVSDHVRAPDVYGIVFLIGGILRLVFVDWCLFEKADS